MTRARKLSVFLLPACLSAVLCLLVATAALADTPVPFADYRQESWYLPHSPSVTGGPVASFFNPAAMALSHRTGLDFWWNDRNVRGDMDNYGLALGRNLGYAMQSRVFGDAGHNTRLTDHQISLARGGRRGTWGLAYRWSSGDGATARQQVLATGLVSRPSRYLTLGAAGLFSLESDHSQCVLDLGLRPLGRPWLTLHADWTANGDEAFFADGSWGAGLEVRPIQGLHLGVRARQKFAAASDEDEVEYALMAGVTLNSTSWSALPRLDSDGNLDATSYLVRSEPPFSGRPVRTPALFTPLPGYYPLNLENKILTYQKYRYLDDKHVAWLDLLRLLQRMEPGKQLKGVAVNLAGFRGRPSLLWEFRRELQRLQDKGLEIIIHADRLGQSTYYLASVADHLSLDPWGEVALPGLVLTRSYLKGTLEKLGVGFQELRYFKYKSAVESLSRDSMSPADREQRQRLVDLIYDEFARAVTRDRQLPAGRYDEAVDQYGRLTADEALSLKMVDRVGRWDELGSWLRKNRGAGFATGEALQPATSLPYDDNWGPALRIPVVYAVGVCDMDTGIKGRATSAYLRSLIRDPRVVAVVLRADSPGGDPLPSDLVGQAVRDLRKAGKPVIVSQGDVAASGGYWISMDGTRILTTPLTITGSIGVISGWAWNDGLADKLGITADSVERGRHAGLYSSVNIPFLGSLPRRAMNQEELDRAEHLIRGMYDQFVAAAARGRGMDPARVGELAQGRVWLGGDAVQNGLCDGFGTLADAIDLARTQAGVPGWRPTQVVEYPPRPLIKLPSLMPRLPSLGGLGRAWNGWLESLLVHQGTDAQGPAGPLASTVAGWPGLDVLETDYVQRIGRNAGQPLLMLSPEDLPQDWKEMGTEQPRD